MIKLNIEEGAVPMFSSDKNVRVALGYFLEPEKTREVFVSNPAQPYVNEIIYKTGDLGSLLSDGNFAFHGHEDFQIKPWGTE